MSPAVWIVPVALAVFALAVWWRGRSDREQVRRIAEAAERSRVAQARVVEADAVEAARARADRDRGRKPVDVLDDAMRRGRP